MYTGTVIRVLKVSRISRSTDESTSLTRQADALDRLCDGRGWKEVGRAVDDGVSASKVPPFKRPELGPWLTDPVKINSYDVIAWWRPDRAVRSMRDLHALMGWARDHGKKLIFAEGPVSGYELDMSNPLTEVMITLMAFAAQIEADSIKERVQSSHNYLATQPRWPGGAAPYGYRIIDRKEGGKTLELVEEEARVIQDIVDMVLDGNALQSVAVTLNRTGVPAPRAEYEYKNGTPIWHVNTLGRMLRSVKLLGYKEHKGHQVLTPDGDPIIMAEPVIEPTEFRMLQLALAKQSLTKERTQNTSPLLGIVFCGLCGGPAYRQPERTDKNGYTRPGHYLCYGKRSKGINPCKGARLNEKPLTKRIAEAFLENIGPLDRPEIKFIPGSDHMAELKRTQDALDNLRAESDEGLVEDRQEYINRLRALTARKKKLEALPSEPDRQEEVPSGKTWGEWWEEDSNPDLRRDLLKSAGFKVWLLPGGTSVAWWPGKAGLSMEEFAASLKV